MHQRAGAADGSGHPVTPEEVAILQLMVKGLPLDSIAQHIGLSSRTIRRRLRSLCDRLGLMHPIQAIVWAAQRGLL
jgi:DNA-binding NarL/FixJ family response regulator